LTPFVLTALKPATAHSGCIRRVSAHRTCSCDLKVHRCGCEAGTGTGNNTCLLLKPRAEATSPTTCFMQLFSQAWEASLCALLYPLWVRKFYPFLYSPRNDGSGFTCSLSSSPRKKRVSSARPTAIIEFTGSHQSTAFHACHSWYKWLQCTTHALHV